MKRKALTPTLILALLFSAITATQFVNLGSANPYIGGGFKLPPEGTQPPTISIFSPNNNTVFASNNVTLTFNVTMLEERYTLSAVYFVMDWQEGVYCLDRAAPDYFYIQNLTGIPEGNHRITISAYANGYYIEGLTLYSSEIRGSSSVCFSIEKQVIGKPFPTVPVAAASVAVVAVVIAGLLLYLRRRKRQASGMRQNE